MEAKIIVGRKNF